MTPIERYTKLVAEMRRLGVTVERKSDHWYWKAMHYALLVVSFGKMTTFLTSYHTTIGNKIGVSNEFLQYSSTADKYIAFRHELQHVKQFRRYGFGNAWLGAALCAIPYLLLPLPMGLAYCRAQLEKEAYAETIRATVQCRGRQGGASLRAGIVRQFTGPSYLWMWPFKAHIEKWFDETLERICQEEGV